jgi:hypothetical protein
VLSADTRPGLSAIDRDRRQQEPPRGWKNQDHWGRPPGRQFRGLMRDQATRRGAPDEASCVTVGPRGDHATSTACGSAPRPRRRPSPPAWRGAGPGANPRAGHRLIETSQRLSSGQRERESVTSRSRKRTTGPQVCSNHPMAPARARSRAVRPPGGPHQRVRIRPAKAMGSRETDSNVDRRTARCRVRLAGCQRPKGVEDLATTEHAIAERPR